MHYQGANLPITLFLELHWRSKLKKNWHPVGRINGWQGAVVGKLARLLRKITDSPNKRSKLGFLFYGKKNYIRGRRP